MKTTNDFVKMCRKVIKARLQFCTVRQLEKKIGVSKSTISRFSKGKIINIHSLHLIGRYVNKGLSK